MVKLSWILVSAGIFVSTSTMAEQYNFSALHFPETFIPNGMNDLGQLVGLTGQNVDNHGGFFDGQSVLRINVPGPYFTYPRDINNAGQIVGFYSPNDFTGGSMGFIYSGGTFTSLTVPGASTTRAFGINEAGQIVGNFRDASGTHGFLKSGQQFTTIDVPGAIATELHGINDAGAIVGTFQTALGIRHGFLYEAGLFTTITPPGASQDGDYGALGINNAGQIVGSFEEEILGGGRHGYVFSNGTFTNIVYGNSILDQQSYAINTLGQVVGIYSSSRGYDGYIATPVPEPSIFAGLIAGLLPFLLGITFTGHVFVLQKYFLMV
jgi:probable HAF family extracellular repeat protein